MFCFFKFNLSFRMCKLCLELGNDSRCIGWLQKRFYFYFCMDFNNLLFIDKVLVSFKYIDFYIFV